MQQGITREQLWEKLTKLDPFQQQSVAEFIDSLLQTKAAGPKRNKQALLALSNWTDEDVSPILEVQQYHHDASDYSER